MDLRGTPCPLNYIRCQLAFEKLAVGASLSVQLDAGEPAETVIDGFREAGQLVEVDRGGGPGVVAVRITRRQA